MRPYSYFHPPTGTTRPVLPTDYVKRRKWVEAIEQFLTLITNEEITNINQQMSVSAKLFVSNVISRVIAQITGQTPNGFETIKGSLEGALHVVVAPDITGPPALSKAKIDIATTATHEIIAAPYGKRLYICSMFFTVAGEVNITLLSGTTPLTGAMDFGGTNEPRGMVAPMGLGPLPCSLGEPFNIELSADIQVSGACTYYIK